MHPTSDKGDLGTVSVMADLIRKGFDVCQPISSTLPFDLVILKNNVFYKVQVKYRKMVDGCVEFEMLRSIISDGKIVTRRIRPEEVDLYALYCPDTNQCYYIQAITVSNLQQVKFRMHPPKNNQLKGVKMAKDYLEVPLGF